MSWNNKNKLVKITINTFLLGGGLVSYLLGTAVFSQSIPNDDALRIKNQSNSDISRIKMNENQHRTLNDQSLDTQLPQFKKPTTPSEDTLKKIQFNLSDVNINGSTVFSASELRKFYKKDLNKTVALERIYKIADGITALYKQQGYVSSFAFVPQQSIINGVVKIQIIEGYIQEVKLPADIRDDSVIKAYIAEIKQLKPIKSMDMESILLRLNDLSGYNITGKMSIVNISENGGLTLELNNTQRESSTQISVDNYLSRFLGVHEAVFTHSTSFAPRHKTTFSGIKSLAFQRLTHLSLNHEFAILPKIKFDFAASYTQSKPGLNLDELDLQSLSRFLSFGVDYNMIRQRAENLDFKISLDSRDTHTDLKAFNFVFIRDQIRTLRLNAKYNQADNWNGSTFFDATFSQGLNALGANDKNSDKSSRAEATPNFQKFELSISRIQQLTDNLTLVASGLGQVASDPLFSAEEIGYGGQSFGRSFDASEITGDDGLLASFEMRYDGMQKRGKFGFQPYGFYDIGRLWNKDSTQISYQTASSAGLGMRISSSYGLNANTSFAIPFIKDIQTPIYGQANSDPRFSFQMSQKF